MRNNFTVSPNYSNSFHERYSSIILFSQKNITFNSMILNKLSIAIITGLFTLFFFESVVFDFIIRTFLDMGICYLHMK